MSSNADKKSAAEQLAAGQEPVEPWHPEAYRYRRTVATGTTEQEALAKVKEIAFGSLLRQEMAPEPIATS